MSNGRITDAEIELELSGDRRSIDRLLLTGQKELKQSIADIATSVDAMRQTCEERGLMCPGMHANLADPMATPSPDLLSRETWVMWGVGSNFLKWLGASGIGAGVALLVNFVIYRHP